ncbi:unnamed protein product [Linum trigynum]|uniref:Uncharacterized protein n=1 Tax=Linum trigynum TaxID=586398 RepID=A0AAV2G1B4_9ROSI
MATGLGAVHHQAKRDISSNGFDFTQVFTLTDQADQNRDSTTFYPTFAGQQYSCGEKTKEQTSWKLIFVYNITTWSRIDGHSHEQ